MTAIAETLATPGLLPGVPSADLVATARYWRPQRLLPGEPLFSQGAPADALGLLLSGELVAEAEGVVIATIPAGELVGEISAFLSRATRSATVTASQPSHMLMLRSASLLGLRRRGSPVYGALLECALRSSCQRVERTSLRLADGFKVLHDPTIEPPAPDGEGLHERSPAPPPILPLLQALPGMGLAAPQVLSTLSGAFEPVTMQRGQPVVSEGRPGDQGYLVAQGRVSVQRRLDVHTRAELTLLQPGAPLGFNMLIHPSRRTATCVALDDGWLYRMDRTTYQQLTGPTRLAWQEALLATLAAQLRIANSLAAGSPTALVGDHHLPITDFGQLLKAGGALVSLGAAHEPAAVIDPLTSQPPFSPAPPTPAELEDA